MRVLFMSGYSDEAVYRHGELSPNAAFIEKPFTERTLAAEGARGARRMKPCSAFERGGRAARLPRMVRLCAVAALLCAAVAAASALAQSPGSLQGRIDRGRARERTLGTAVARLGRLERATAREIAILEPRLRGGRDGADAARGRGWPPRARAWTRRAGG